MTLIINDKYDVIIIGSGPSGASCAYWSAKAGLRVLLIDKNEFPRSKTCGDGLTWESIRELQKMQLWDIIEPISQIYRHVDIFDQRNGEIVTSWSDSSNNRWGAVIERIQLDYQIVLHSVRIGCDFIDNIQINSVQVDESGYIYFCTKNSINYKFSAKYTIIATGANRTIFQLFNLPYKRQFDSLAVRSYIKLPQNYEYDRLRIYIEKSMTGYSWMFPMRSQTGNLGIGLTIKDNTTTKIIRQQLRYNLRELMQTYELFDENNLNIHGYPILSDYPGSMLASGNILVIGEAAGLVDPLTGEGIGPSLVSARYAAQAIIDEISGAYSYSAAQLYYNQIHETYNRYYRESRVMLDIVEHKVGYRIFSAIPSQSFARHIHTAVFQQQPVKALEQMSISPDLLKYQKDLDVLLLLRYKQLMIACRDLMINSIKNDNIDPYIIHIVERGRMLRALLVFIGAKVAGGDPERMISGAAGIELVHCASLIHDDIIDNAEYRRGILAVHRVNSISQSIVIGDYLIAKSFELLAYSRSNNPDSYVVDSFIIGAISGINACRGQYRDSMTYSIDDWDEKSYIELTIQKTASVLKGALISGAKLAGCDSNIENVLELYGTCLGIAFQLKDDIDDLNDIKNGSHVDKKINLPLIYAYQQENHNNREIIRAFLRGDFINLMQLSEILTQKYIIEYCNNQIHQYIARAVDYVACIHDQHPELSSIARAVWNVSDLHEYIFSQ